MNILKNITDKINCLNEDNLNIDEIKDFINFNENFESDLSTTKTDESKVNVEKVKNDLCADSEVDATDIKNVNVNNKDLFDTVGKKDAPIVSLVDRFKKIVQNNGIENSEITNKDLNNASREITRGSIRKTDISDGVVNEAVVDEDLLVEDDVEANPDVADTEKMSDDETPTAEPIEREIDDSVENENSIDKPATTENSDSPKVDEDIKGDEVKEELPTTEEDLENSNSAVDSTVPETNITDDIKSAEETLLQAIKNGDISLEEIENILKNNTEVKNEAPEEIANSVDEFSKNKNDTFTLEDSKESKDEGLPVEEAEEIINILRSFKKKLNETECVCDTDIENPDISYDDVNPDSSQSVDVDELPENKKHPSTDDIPAFEDSEDDTDIENPNEIVSEECMIITEANADQVKSNSKIANKIKDYLRKYGVKFTWRINKHISAVERLFKGNPDDIRLAMVAMPLARDPYYGTESVIGTRIILVFDDKFMIYGKGILSGGKAQTVKFDRIHDVIVDEGMIWSKIRISMKQGNNAYETTLSLGRIHKDASEALYDFLKSHTKGKFTKNFDKDDKSLNENAQMDVAFQPDEEYNYPEVVQELPDDTAEQHLQSDTFTPYKSIKDAYMTQPGYFEKSTDVEVTPDDKKDALIRQMALLVSKESNDPMFDELIQAAATYKQLQKAIVDKYTIIASAKCDEFIESKNQMDAETEETIQEAQGYCEKCGHILGENGQCPECPAGDPDALDDKGEHTFIDQATPNSEGQEK